MNGWATPCAIRGCTRAANLLGVCPMHFWDYEVMIWYEFEVLLTRKFLALAEIAA